MSFKKRNALLVTILFMTCFSLYQMYFLSKLAQQNETAESPFKKTNAKDTATTDKRNDTQFNKEYYKYMNNGILRGVLERDYLLKYHVTKEFQCLDGNLSIPTEWLNDDYCDCEDGSDEPSTNACLKGIYYCESQPFESPIFVHSSKVNDGICDCCDGSDEWLSKGLVLTQYSNNLHRQYAKSCLNICNLAKVQ